MIKMDREFVAYASVRDALSDTFERRGFLTYEQKMALQHAEWAASDNRNGIPIHPDDVRAVLASRRIAMDTDDIENIIEVIRQKVGVE